MNRLKIPLLSSILFLLVSISSISLNAQNEVEAHQSVIKYMTAKFKGYESKGFGELFVQNYPEDVQKELKTKKQVKYSMIHLYSIKGEDKQDYIHLDKDLKVIGILSFDVMMQLAWKTLMQNKEFTKTMDSLGVDTNNVRFKQDGK